MTDEKRKEQFVYCNYWGKWNRLLGRRCYSYVELNLTPVNGFNRGRIEEVKLEVIREHGTTRSEEDIVTDKLPYDIKLFMEINLGEELTNKLLTFDYWSIIKDKKWDHLSNGGGVPFANILSGQYHFWK